MTLTFIIVFVLFALLLEQPPSCHQSCLMVLVPNQLVLSDLP